MKNIAIIEGGYSREKEISIKSAQKIFENIDKTKLNPTKVFIDENEWTAYDSEGRYPIDKNSFSYIKENIRYNFDYAFIMIHGSPGEDGKLQSYFEMIGIPYNTSSSYLMALTFHKFYCNQLLKNFEINVPASILIKPKDKIDENKIIKTIGLPCFVKPTAGGSSLGITKVKDKKDLTEAIKLALKLGGEAIIETLIIGREITNGVFRDEDGIKVLPITEIISKNEFFDYKAKYQGLSEEITPAELDETTKNKVKKLTYEIYSILGLYGIVRIDYFIDREENIYLIEINSIPGMSNESIIPKMLKTQGINFQFLLNKIIKF